MNNAVKLFSMGLLVLSLGLFSCEKEAFAPEEVVDSAGEEVDFRSSTGLTEALAVEWNEMGKYFVVVGVGPNGDLDAYYGNKGNFTKIPDGNDLDVKYSASGFAGFAMGRFAGNKQLITMTAGKDGTVVFGRQNGAGVILNDARGPEKVGDLDEILAIEWDPKFYTWVVVGRKGGELDAYLGTQAAWWKYPTWKKLKDNRDFNKWLGLSFVDFAIGIGADGNLDILGVSSNGSGSTGREFYSKPWLGDNIFQIGSLKTCLAVEWDAENKRFVVIGEGPDGTLDAYAGDKDNFCKLQNNQDFQKWIGGPANFADFALGATFSGTQPNQRLKALGVMVDGRGSTGRGFAFDCKLHLGDNQFSIP
jgi:hypothetical protein